MQQPLSFEATPWVQGNSWVATIKAWVADFLDHDKTYEFIIKELEGRRRKIGVFEASPRNLNTSSIITIDKKLIALMNTSKKYRFLIPSMLIEVKNVEKE